MNLNREDLINLLKKTEVIVTFTKADGTERDMHCTLQPTCFLFVKKWKAKSRRNAR